MDDDSIAGEVISTIGSELSKLGKSVTSQITGSSSDLGQSKKSTPLSKADFSLFGELKKFGQSAQGQVSGHLPTDSEIAQMVKKDDEFSEQEGAAVRAKIARIYQEHEARRKKEKQLAEQQQAQIEQTKKEKQEVIQVKRSQEVNPMVERAKAEIKNYGAE